MQELSFEGNQLQLKQSWCEDDDTTAPRSDEPYEGTGLDSFKQAPSPDAAAWQHLKRLAPAGLSQQEKRLRRQASNREAARRSRERKNQYIATLSEEISRLEGDNEELTCEVVDLARHNTVMLENFAAGRDKLGRALEENSFLHYMYQQLLRLAGSRGLHTGGHSEDETELPSSPLNLAQPSRCSFKGASRPRHSPPAQAKQLLRSATAPLFNTHSEFQRLPGSSPRVSISPNRSCTAVPNQQQALDHVMAGEMSVMAKRQDREEGFMDFIEGGSEGEVMGRSDQGGVVRNQRRKSLSQRSQHVVSFSIQAQCSQAAQEAAAAKDWAMQPPPNAMQLPFSNGFLNLSRLDGSTFGDDLEGM